MQYRARAGFGALSLLLALVSGCASGGGVHQRTGDASPQDGPTTEHDAGELFCDPPCGVDEACVEGVCRTIDDTDDDGVPDTLDCDPMDASVGTMAEHLCTGACGEGLERCTDGVWTECSAPTSCDCEPGAPPRMIACERCGMQRQTCIEGRWTNDGGCTAMGACSPGEVGMGSGCGNCGVERRTCGMDCSWGAWACEGEGECAAGAMQSESASCGTCGSGTQTRTRTCDSMCRWGDYGPYGACSGGGSGVCTPGETDTETESCGNCGLGTRSRTRTCDPVTCDWGEFGPFGTCSGGGVCAAGATRACANGDSCGQEVCSASCTWSGTCTPRISGGCLRIRAGRTEEGTNYRCCTSPPPAGDANGTGWQYCLPTCQWSTACEATTSC